MDNEFSVNIIVDARDEDKVKEMEMSGKPYILVNLRKDPNYESNIKLADGKSNISI